MNNNICIIGSTGVLGSKLLRYLKKYNKNIDLITCNTNYKKLLKQKKLYKINNAIVMNDRFDNYNINLNYGENYLIDHIKNCSIKLFYVLNTGFESLKYINYVIKFQKNCLIAIANKEILIAGGTILIDKIISSGNSFLPLDSEHFSLIDLLPKRKIIKNSVSKIFLTASGGPFYFNKKFNINNVNLKKAIKHPLWEMGAKNSIDSSNLVNKILECFELSSIYDFPLKKIDITISPKAFAHSVVFYKDQRISINCFLNDMMIPMTSPFYNDKFYRNNKKKINILTDNDLKFKIFNNKNFQILKYYKKIFYFNHVQQINFMILNAEAVNRFIANKIKYKDIIPFIFNHIDHLPKQKLFKNLYEILKYTIMLSHRINKL